MRNAILYQAYGGKDFINECRYSLLKYLQVYNLNPPAATGIFIYTDQPHFFSDFIPFFHHFQCKEITAEQIKMWRGTYNFMHRLKIEIMSDFLQSFSGNVLYCDTDSYATQPLEPIFENIKKGEFYMHEYEGVLNKTVSPSFHKWEAFLSTQPIVYNNKKLEFSNTIKLFNAGAVGLNSNNKDALDDVLALTDSIYKNFPKHIAEQFAFCYCLQKRGTIKNADFAIAHYWNLKEFRQLLTTFFAKNLEESIPNLVKKVHHIDPLAIQKQKTSYKQLPLLQRLFKNIFGSAWRIDRYEKKL